MMISMRSLDRGVLFEADATSINLKTTSGEVTILDHHRPLMTKLAHGSAVVLKKDGTTERFEVTDGFLEVNRRNQVLILLD